MFSGSSPLRASSRRRPWLTEMDTDWVRLGGADARESSQREAPADGRVDAAKDVVVRQKKPPALKDAICLDLVAGRRKSTRR